jgi:hypothetical protein
MIIKFELNYIFHTFYLKESIISLNKNSTEISEINIQKYKNK